MAGRKKIRCLERAMEILAKVARNGEVGVTELSEQTNLHVATVHNILVTLASQNYVVGIKGRYRIGPAVAMVATHWAPVTTLPWLAKPYMQEMTRETGEASLLAILVGQQVQLIQVTQGTNAVTAQLQSSLYELPMVLATGRLLVALGSKEQREQFIARHISVNRGMTEQQWRRELADIREEGCCIVRRHGEGEVDSVAVPLYGAGGQLLASLGSHTPNFRGTSKHISVMLDELFKAAVVFSQELGYKLAPTSQRKIAAVVAKHFTKEQK